MLRNKEIQVLAFSLIVITLAGVLLAQKAVIQPVSLVLALSAAFLVVYMIFTYWRYRQVAKLSKHLQLIRRGEYTLDVRDHFEGELSILKDNIYKVTAMLSEHHAMLEQDKVYLTEAISDISHQLKTPLTSMMMMADFLQAEQLPEEKRKEFAGYIQKQLLRIEWLVSALLKLSKIDARAVTFKEETISASELIETSLEPVQMTIELKDQQIDIKGASSVSFTGDFYWTREALLNVLKNSVEHTPPGSVIEIAVSENALYTEFRIKDTGPGISKKDLPYLFQRFYKGEHAGEDSVGIGLAMSQSIIESQNGTIEVASRPGQGTAFIIKFYKNRTSLGSR